MDLRTEHLPELRGMPWRAWDADEHDGATDRSPLIGHGRSEAEAVEDLHGQAIGRQVRTPRPLIFGAYSDIVPAMTSSATGVTMDLSRLSRTAKAQALWFYRAKAWTGLVRDGDRIFIPLIGRCGYGAAGLCNELHDRMSSFAAFTLGDAIERAKILATLTPERQETLAGKVEAHRAELV